MNKIIKLTIPEINHILTLISMNEKDRWVYENTEQYWKRSNRIKDKLMKQEGGNTMDELQIVQEISTVCRLL